jgi:hypothetical protein
MEFTVGGDQRDLRGLDLRDRVELCRGLSDAERNGLRMDTEGGVTFGVQDGSAGGIECGAEVGSALEVSEDADELHEVALCGVSIVGGCHDDRELNFLRTRRRWMRQPTIC